MGSKDGRVRLLPNRIPEIYFEQKQAKEAKKMQILLQQV
jgi:hypothetical protein